MAHYDDVILPDRIAFGSRSGPSTSTQIVFTNSGFRKVNARWSQKLRKLQIGYGIRTPRDAYTVQKLFEAVGGPENSFLVKDWTDWNSTEGYMDETSGASMITATDQPLKNTVTGEYTGDGSTTTFQMVKRYLSGSTASHERTIIKPKQGTVKVAIDGVEQGAGFSINFATGIVTFNAAPSGSPDPEVTWGGEFYVPVSFVSDDFLTELATFDGNSIPDVELLEERL